jgi:glycosyltransferase involved in cell wall biosynthesis
MIVHLVYPCSDSIASPYTIGRHVAAGLEAQFGYEVQVHDWESLWPVDPAPGDVLLGHPHPNPFTIFRRSLRKPGWRRVIVMTPLNTDVRQAGFLDPIVEKSDLFLAISGAYWMQRLPASPLSHWGRKIIHVDMAVDREEFLPLKTEFSPPGSRRVLYIGHSGWQKNPDYLEAIRAAHPSTEFGWLGSGTRPLAGYTPYGHLDLDSAEARRIIDEHDFLLTVGRSDANPATILEAMAWGLIPVCTPESGYLAQAGIVNVPLDDLPAAVKTIAGLQKAAPEELERLQRLNWESLDRHFNWQRFVGQVAAAIEDEWPRPSERAPLSRRLALRARFLPSPYYPWRPGNASRFAYHALKRGLQSR